jgi:hypothetical protein
VILIIIEFNRILVGNFLILILLNTTINLDYFNNHSDITKKHQYSAEGALKFIKKITFHSFLRSFVPRMIGYGGPKGRINPTPPVYLFEDRARFGSLDGRMA